MKLYVLKWETTYSDGSSANGLYTHAFKTLEEAEAEIDVIRWDEMCEWEDNGYNMDDIKANTHHLLTEHGFIIEIGDDYVKWVVEEVEVVEHE